MVSDPIRTWQLEELVSRICEACSRDKKVHADFLGFFCLFFSEEGKQ